MKKSRLAALTFALTLSATSAALAAEPVKIESVPSSFTPQQITLHVGVATEIDFVHTQGVHEIESAALGIPATTIVPGKDVAIVVTPKKMGTYVLHCELVCGEDHDKMTLVISVVP